MDSVFLLYEGDEWLAQSSMVLMGVFTNQAELKFAARELIEQRADEHLDIAKSNYDFDEGTTYEDVVDDIMTELFSRRSTVDWLTNYSIVEVKTNKLEEI